jgi:hypothetical protein
MNPNHPSQINRWPDSVSASSWRVSKSNMIIAWLLALTMNYLPSSKAQNFSAQDHIKAQTEYLTPNQSNLTIKTDTAKEVFETFEQTKWKHEIALKVDGHVDGKEVEANEVEKISTGTADHVEVDLNKVIEGSDAHIISHNHPDTGALAFSAQDIKTNLELNKQITTDWYHILQKTYEHEWIRYPSFIVSKLDNEDNKSWCKFTIDDQEFSHLFLCPDGELRDITEIDPEFAQEVLMERLAVADGEAKIVKFPNNNEESLKLAS